MHFTCFLYYLYPWLKMVTNQNNVALWTLIKLSLKETHTHTHTHMILTYKRQQDELYNKATNVHEVTFLSVES